MRSPALPCYAGFLAVAPVAIHIEPLLVGLSELARLLICKYLLPVGVVAACLRLRHSPRLSYIVVPTARFTTAREQQRRQGCYSYPLHALLS
jgi:hypothetical protein